MYSIFLRIYHDEVLTIPIHTIPVMENHHISIFSNENIPILNENVDLEIIFYQKNEFIIHLYDCPIFALEQGHFEILVDDIQTYPTLHSQIFTWLDTRFRQQTLFRAWQDFSEQDKFYWLRLNFDFQRIFPKQSPKSCQINGLCFHDKLGFLCELGEQLFGVGGYAGSDLDGCYDVLSNGISDMAKIDQHLSITWQHYSHSVQVMDKNEIAMILDILNSTVNLVLLD